jgi:hypothetical protein
MAGNKKFYFRHILVTIGGYNFTMSDTDDIWGKPGGETATAHAPVKNAPVNDSARDPVGDALAEEQAPSVGGAAPTDPPPAQEPPPAEPQSPQPNPHGAAPEQTQPAPDDPLKQVGRAKIDEIVRDLGEQRSLLEGMKTPGDEKLAIAVDGLKAYLTQHATMQVIAIRDEHGLVQKPGQDHARLSQDGPPDDKFQDMSQQEKVDHLRDMRNRYSKEITNEEKLGQFNKHLDTVLDAVQGHGQDKAQDKAQEQLTTQPQTPSAEHAPPNTGEKPLENSTPPPPEKPTQDTPLAENQKVQTPAGVKITDAPPPLPQDPAEDAIYNMEQTARNQAEVAHAMSQPVSARSGVRIDPEVMAMINQIIEDGRKTGLHGSLPPTAERDMKEPAKNTLGELIKVGARAYEGPVREVQLQTGQGTSKPKTIVGRE